MPKFIMFKTYIYAILLFLLIACDSQDNRQEKLEQERNKAIAERDKVIPTDYPIKIIDSTGKELTILKKPERIVVTGTPLYTEILADLGALNQIIAVTSSPNNPKEVENVLKVGTSLQPNLEEIVKLKPDLVMGTYGEFRDKLEDFNLIVVLVGKAPYGMIDSEETIYNAIETLSLCVYGNKQRSEELIATCKQRIRLIEEKVKECPEVTVAVLYTSIDGVFYGEGKNTISDNILKRMKGKNIFSNISAFQQVSIEDIIKYDPAIIITDPSQISMILANEKLKNVRAIKNNKIFGIKASQWTSSRIYITVELVAQYLHPEAFATEEHK